MRKRGRLIVFEGPDGVGKSELSGRLAFHLRGLGLRLELWSFPGNQEGTLGQHVYRLHHEPREFGLRHIHPASLQILHIAAHVDSIEERILPALRAGTCVILDRFWWSTWVYGVVYGVQRQSLKAMIQLELASWGKVKPDALFLISRSGPLREEPVAAWNDLLSEYKVLANQERKKYPVYDVVNDASIDDAASLILGLSRLAGDRSVAVSPSGPGGQTTTGGYENRRAPTVFTRLTPAKPTNVYETYWRFATERQAAFHRRAMGELPPWTDDPILQKYKFTNVYRASDRVSQYLIRHVIYAGDQCPEEIFFRTMLFKLFNRIDTWNLLQESLGEIRFATYRFNRFDRVLTQAIDHGKRIYSAAYIMPSGGRVFGFSRKHRTHLKLIEQMMKEDVPSRLAKEPSMKSAFELLRSYPTLGDFLAYQYVTDINYSTLTDFDEMEFVVPGPGARDGIRKCFSDLGGLSEADLIRMVCERQDTEFDRLGLEFQSLWGRPLQLIDCQNLFCEVDKYARVRHPEVKGLTGRTRIKQRFQPQGGSIELWYPPKWGINDRLPRRNANVSGFLWKDR